MERENPQTKAVNGDASKKVRNKNNKQATVLKQLSNQKLYPLHERIGIYVIAVLSTIGLVLIIYTGVMALLTAVVPDEVTVEARPDVDMDLDSIDDLLVDVSDVLDAIDEEDEEPDESDFQQDESELHVYVDPENGDDDDEEMPAQGVINTAQTEFRTQPGAGNIIVFLQPGAEIRILDFNYNDEWARIEAQVDFGTGPASTPGFVNRQFIDIE